MAEVSAAIANRQFSKLIRRASTGEFVTITSHGRPVARLIPIGRDTSGASEARSRLIDRLRGQAALGVTWTRDELYDGP